MSATAAPKKSTALDLLKQHEGALLAETRERWELEQLVTIWTTIAEGATFGEFSMFMSLADRYDLNPLAHEIWFSKNKSGKVMIMVGRDGLLAVARRTGDFRTVRGDVHRKNDNFRVIHQSNGEDTVEHSYEGSPEDRGEIVGSWCQIQRADGSFTNYTYTPLEEYFPEGNYSSPWKKQTSAMIQKCSVSLALRIAYGISGVVGEDEVSGDITAPVSLTDGEGTGEIDSVELTPEIEAVVSRAEELGAEAWANRATWQYRMKIMSEEALATNIANAQKQLDLYEVRSADVSEADVVADEPPYGENRDVPQKIEDLDGGVSAPPDDQGSSGPSLDVTEGSVESDSVVQEVSPAAAIVGMEAYPDKQVESDEMKTLRAKRQYIEELEAVGEEEEDQKAESLNFVDEQIAALQEKEASQQQELL